LFGLVENPDFARPDLAVPAMERFARVKGAGSKGRLREPHPLEISMREDSARRKISD
jgi:hypothetical protein